MNELPSISVVLPTYNSENVLGDCLKSIRGQDYPVDKVEIIVADGGSRDRTLEIAREFGIENVLPNPLKTGEAGKAVGVKAARNEIVALIDSDNILPDKEWLLRMVEPFEDPEVVGSEPLYYTYQRDDGYITRYCALLGMNDPLCLFLGNYDRYSTLTNKWTEMPHEETDKGGYVKIELEKNHLPTIGANGFLIRRSRLEKCNIGNYLFDVDVVHELLSSVTSSNQANSSKFAKVKTGIVHLFSGDLRTFAIKQRRRVNDYLFYSRLGIRKYPWKSASKIRLARFVFYCLTIVPLLMQSLKGYKKRPDRAWFFHPLACWITLWEYGLARIGATFGVSELRREEWGVRL